MRFIPRDYQSLTANHAIAFLRSADVGEKQMYSGPTGIGKSVIELLIAEELPTCLLITPRLEIIKGLLDKLGISTDCESEESLIALAESNRIHTPVRFRNRMLQGNFSPLPKYLIFDEGHHHNAESWQQIDLLTGLCPSVSFTATPYRGTPKATKELIERWGEAVPIMTYAEAIEQHLISFPSVNTVPLIDDDTIEISNGEFRIESVESATRNQFARIHDVARQYAMHVPSNFDAEGEVTRWKRPTVFNAPSRNIAHEFAEYMTTEGLTAYAVTDKTSYRARQLAFHEMLECRAAVVQIGIVAEGIDLPIRQVFDFAPVLSPVRIVQQMGRCMRPTDIPPNYVCFNRNIMRHAYLFDGVLPARCVAEAQQAFGQPSQRIGQRVVGFAELGRFKGTRFPMKNGCEGILYTLTMAVEMTISEYAAVASPINSDVLWARRTHAKNDDGTKAYGRWEKCEPPNELKGFASVKEYPLSPKQKQFWDRSAEFYGLRKDVKITTKQFQVLPILKDLGVRFS